MEGVFLHGGQAALDPAKATSLGVNSPPRRRLIRFQSADEFKAREQYRHGVDPRTRKLVGPIGWYSLPKAGYCYCGLQGCNREHGLGLVVLFDDDTETNIGHCCGSKKYGLEWQQLGIQLEQLKRDYAIKDLADRISRDKERLLREATELRNRVFASRQAIEPIITIIRGDRALYKAFEECRRAGGKLTYFRDLTEDERDYYPGQRTVAETVGQIEGIEAAFSSDLVDDIKRKVLARLWEWQDVDISHTKRKRLEEIAMHMRDFDEVLTRAREFIVDAQRFPKPSNWDSFYRFVIADSVYASTKAKDALRDLAGIPRRRYY